MDMTGNIIINHWSGMLDSKAAISMLGTLGETALRVAGFTLS